MTDLGQRLRSSFRWMGDRTDPDYRADVTGWWRDAEILEELGEAPGGLHGTGKPSVVIGKQSRGSLLGVLTAKALRIGFAEVRKNPSRGSDSDSWWEASTSPDYRDRHLDLGIRQAFAVEVG